MLHPRDHHDLDDLPDDWPPSWACSAPTSSATSRRCRTSRGLTSTASATAARTCTSGSSPAATARGKPVRVVADRLGRPAAGVPGRGRRRRRRGRSTRCRAPTVRRLDDRCGAGVRQWVLLLGAIACEVTGSLSLKAALDRPAFYGRGGSGVRRVVRAPCSRAPRRDGARRRLRDRGALASRPPRCSRGLRPGPHGPDGARPRAGHRRRPAGRASGSTGPWWTGLPSRPADGVRLPGRGDRDGA